MGKGLQKLKWSTKNMKKKKNDITSHQRNANPKHTEMSREHRQCVVTGPRGVSQEAEDLALSPVKLPLQIKYKYVF